ncbi:tyrosine-type recombinase/integrase [Pantoea agglomerans]|uniref:tyrosine-type recombinase/integrase n=1 Tax=Enterobacter agglomerans TaxID=549 RepID=UPI003C7E1557
MKTQITEKHLVLKVKDSDYEVDCEQDNWILSKDIKLNINKLSLHFETSFFERIKNTLAYCFTTLSSATTRKYYYALTKLANFSEGYLNDFNTTTLNRFYNTFNYSSYTHVQSIKYFINLYTTVNRDIDTTKLKETVSKWKLFIPNRSKSHEEIDYHSAPFEKQEVQYILKKVSELYTNEKITAIDYCIFLLMTYTGTRPQQLALLKCGDLYKNNSVACLRVPRMKQKMRFREDFDVINISEYLYVELNNLRCMYQQVLKEEYGLELDKKKSDSIPLIINNHFFNSAFDMGDLFSSNAMNAHLTSKKVTQRIKYVYSIIEKKESLINKNINSRKMRVTLATRVGNKGYDISVISKMLDHTNTKSVISYAMSNKENAYRIDKYIDDKIFPIALKFVLKEGSNQEGLRKVFDLLNELRKFTKDYYDNDLFIKVDKLIKKTKRDIKVALLGEEKSACI